MTDDTVELCVCRPHSVLENIVTDDGLSILIYRVQSALEIEFCTPVGKDN